MCSFVSAVRYTFLAHAAYNNNDQYRIIHLPILHYCTRVLYKGEKRSVFFLSIFSIFFFPTANVAAATLYRLGTFCRRTHKMYNRYPGLARRTKSSRPVPAGGRFMDFCALFARRTEKTDFYPIVNIPYTGSINPRKQPFPTHPGPFRRTQ